MIVFKREDFEIGATTFTNDDGVFLTSWRAAELANKVIKQNKSLIRAEFAKAAMTGLAANNEYPLSYKEWATDAVDMADALIRELEK